jgi:CubicO group peptidase (beta-lactamase class C family)
LFNQKLLKPNQNSYFSSNENYMKSLLSFILLLLVVTNVVAQKNAIAINPVAAGFSPEKLKKLDASLNDWAKNEWMNGGVALIIRNDNIAYYKAVGFNNLATKEALQKEAIFRIASQTKAITSVAIMQLYEDGRFLLDDAISKYIPAFAKQQVLDKFNAADTTYTTVKAKREITFRDLLTHTSGLGYAQIGSKEANAIYAKNNITAGIGVDNDKLSNAMNKLGKLPLMHQPGERWTYGLNSDLLGYLVELLSGISLSDYFNEKIFKPLGMMDTYFNIPKAKANRLVNLYAEDSLGVLKILTASNLLNGPTVANYPLMPHTYFSGGAGLSSTIYDYAIFLQMLLHNGQYNGAAILSKNTVRMMTMNQIGDVAFGDNKFGLGFEIVTEKGSSKFPAQVGTYSWGGAFATSYWVDPKEKMVLLFYRQLQGGTHGDVVNKFRALTYQAIKK